jgi:hypothetical protein
MMNTRAGFAASALLAIAGAAFGQSTTAARLSYSLTWQDTGNHNGVLEVGESAVLRLSVTMTPVVNTVIPFTGGVGGPTGTLRGVASGFIDVVGTGGTQGAFNLDEAAGYGTDLIWSGTVDPHSGTPNGTGIMDIQFGQVATGSSTVMTTNPVVNVWSTAWTPASYAARTVTFGTAVGSASGGIASAVIIKWGPLNGNIQAASCLSDFGTLNIPIVPAPGGLALLGIAGALTCARPRRRS